MSNIHDNKITPKYPTGIHWKAWQANLRAEVENGRIVVYTNDGSRWSPQSGLVYS